MILGSAEIGSIAVGVTTLTTLFKKAQPNVNPWIPVFSFSFVGLGLWLASQSVLPTRLDIWPVFVAYGLICVSASGVYELATSTIQTMRKDG